MKETAFIVRQEKFMKSKVIQLTPKKIIRVQEAEDVSNKGSTPLHTRQ